MEAEWLVGYVTNSLSHLTSVLYTIFAQISTSLQRYSSLGGRRPERNWYYLFIYFCSYINPPRNILDDVAKLIVEIFYENKGNLFFGQSAEVFSFCTSTTLLAGGQGIQTSALSGQSNKCPTTWRDKTRKNWWKNKMQSINEQVGSQSPWYWLERSGFCLKY